MEETHRLLDLGAAGVCIDVAHGHSDRMFRLIADLKKSHPDKDVIAGNVCTAMAYHDLVNVLGLSPFNSCARSKGSWVT